jgi:hypothetical protein
VEAKWYYARWGQQQGPVTSQQLHSLAQAGQLSPNDLVWKEGLPNWVEASRVRGLFGEDGEVDLELPRDAGQRPEQPGPYVPPQPAIPIGYQTQPLEPAPPNYLVQSILVTICCCLPFGIVAIVYTAQVNAKHQAGDYTGASEASRKARFWSWMGFGFGILFGIFYSGIAIMGEL